MNVLGFVLSYLHSPVTNNILHLLRSVSCNKPVTISNNKNMLYKFDVFYFKLNLLGKLDYFPSLFAVLISSYG